MPEATTISSSSSSRLLNAKNSVLLVVDVQERFMPVIHGVEAMNDNIAVLIQAAQILGVPTVVTEQYPKGLGHTIEQLQSVLPEDGTVPVLEKVEFGALADSQVQAALPSERKQLVVCGIETHVCVNQTVHQALEQGWQTHVVRDAVSSRHPDNHATALEKMTQSGAIATTTEMVLFEWLSTSKHPQFKAIQQLIK